jgi:geranylgeranyl pyrophosphate synthase
MNKAIPAGTREAPPPPPRSDGFFASELSRVERGLEEICDRYLGRFADKPGEAVRYALKSPGKRIRPLLVLLSYRAAGGEGDASVLSCAPEVIHAYSLVHDDLPCMDDDDIRRGRPTVHKVYGSRTAIRAGMAMIPLAAAVARDSARALGVGQSEASSIVRTLLAAGGAGGMIGGQQRDLAAEGVELERDNLEAIHSAKTGALIVGSVRMGALAAGATAIQVEAFEQYGRSVGLAFQIMDDVLDVTSTTSALGKIAGRDVALGKSTYPALLGVEGARNRAAGLIDSGREALAARNLLTPELSQVANFMVTRTS